MMIVSGRSAGSTIVRRVSMFRLRLGPEMTGTRARVLVELSSPPGAAVDTHSIDRETIYADFLKLSSYMNDDSVVKG